MKEKECFTHCSQGLDLFSRFSHVYVEEDAIGYPVSSDILQKLPKARVITVKNYKDVFNKASQDFEAQKKSQKLILAKKRGDMVYRGSTLCEDFGYENFYYSSSVLNCIYDCDYCYLQGVYPSSNIVVFVNVEDFFHAVSSLTRDKFIYLSISYDSDLLALERLTGLATRWIQYAGSNENLLVEIKTKSGCYSSISDMNIPQNVVLAWTLSPDEVIDRYERLTPSLDIRIENIRKAIAGGLKVRLSFEPIMMIDNFEEVYSNFFEKVFNAIPLHGIRDVNAGIFRMSEVQAKRFNKRRKPAVFCYPMAKKDGVVTYKSYEIMRGFVCDQLSKYLGSEKVFVN
ncbi:SPL family radical SAM protein [Caldanaerobius polysaccharolyticus]|uniref:SPL family radical SAM protein n=1 Tax=Caldanaerobius polysaccharolyticus TaxID=44256 RepID=UPI0006918A92|nr:DNA repair photolyase [Caldanaerobius polysaccharolyticus]